MNRSSRSTRCSTLRKQRRRLTANCATRCKRGISRGPTACATSTTSRISTPTARSPTATRWSCPSRAFRFSWAASREHFAPRKRIRSVLKRSAVFAVCAVALLGVDPPSSAETLYLAAVKATSSRAQPVFETSTLHSHDEGLPVKLIVRNHFVWLGIGSGNGPNTWQLRHRTDDYATEIIDENGNRYVTARSFFDPTWYGT